MWDADALEGVCAVVEGEEDDAGRAFVFCLSSSDFLPSFQKSRFLPLLAPSPVSGSCCVSASLIEEPGESLGNAPGSKGALDSRDPVSVVLSNFSSTEVCSMILMKSKAGVFQFQSRY